MNKWINNFFINQEIMLCFYPAQAENGIFLSPVFLARASASGSHSYLSRFLAVLCSSFSMDIISLKLARCFFRVVFSSLNSFMLDPGNLSFNKASSLLCLNLLYCNTGFEPTVRKKMNIIVRNIKNRKFMISFRSFRVLTKLSWSCMMCFLNTFHLV